ncbi:hypothetical protein AFFFEF_00920 [Methylorubrum extorquens]
MDKHDDVHTAGIPATRSPTRRRLLTLLASLPAVATPNSPVRPLGIRQKARRKRPPSLTCSVPSRHCSSNTRRLSGAATASKPGSSLNSTTRGFSSHRWPASPSVTLPMPTPSRSTSRQAGAATACSKFCFGGSKPGHAVLVPAALLARRDRRPPSILPFAKLPRSSSRPRPEPSAASARSFSCSWLCRNPVKPSATARPGVSCGCCSPTSTPSLSPNASGYPPPPTRGPNAPP